MDAQTPASEPMPETIVTAHDILCVLEPNVRAEHAACQFGRSSDAALAFPAALTLVSAQIAAGPLLAMAASPAAIHRVPRLVVTPSPSEPIAASEEDAP